MKISRRKRGTVLSARSSRSNEEISRIFESEVQEESGAGNELLLRGPHVVSADKIGELESEIDEVKDAHLKLETCGTEETLEIILLCHVSGTLCRDSVVTCVEIVAGMPAHVKEQVQAREHAIHDELGTRKTDIKVIDHCEVRIVAVGVEAADLSSKGDGH